MITKKAAEALRIAKILSAKSTNYRNVQNRVYLVTGAKVDGRTICGMLRTRG